MIRFNHKTDIQALRLSKEDLFELEKIINESITIAEDSYHGLSYVSTDFNGKSISEINVTNLLEHKDLPSIIKKLHIIRSGNDGSSSSISVDLNFYENFITLSVNGDSESMVLGKTTLIKEYLRKKRYKWWFAKSNIALFTEGVLIALGLGAVTVATVEKIMDKPVFFKLPSILFSISVFILIYAVGKIPYTIIQVGDREPFLKRKADVITFIFGLVSVIGVIWEFLKK